MLAHAAHTHVNRAGANGAHPKPDLRDRGLPSGLVEVAIDAVLQLERCELRDPADVAVAGTDVVPDASSIQGATIQQLGEERIYRGRSVCGLRCALLRNPQSAHV